MKKFLAVTLVMMMAMASTLAQTPKRAVTESIVNKAVVQKAASTIKLTPAINAPGATIGFLPVFTDASGNVGNSALFQQGTSIGIGTTAPGAILNIVAANPTLRIDNYSNVTGDSPNFNFLSAHGTAAAPTATLNGDNLGQFAANGYTGAGFGSGTKVKVTFVSTENWTPTANGTAMSFQTTANGTTLRVERMRIDNTGFVGIGTATPAFPLSVNGVVQSLAGGFLFPDGTTQVTAATSGIALTSPDGSVTVAGTPAAPTVAVNPLVLQTQIGAGGSVVNVPVVVAQTSFTGTSGAGAANNIYTAATAGFYRVSVYMNTPVLGTCSVAPCTGESITLQWNDGVSTAALATASCNLVTPCSSSAVTPIWVAAGQIISAYGQSTGSGTTPAGGSYNAFLLVEKL